MIVPIYKPKGPTSHDIVDEIRRITGERRVGHAGTLDPLARGVLVIGIGRDSTRNLAAEVKKEKEYVARIRLGMESDTDDEEGKKLKIQSAKIPTRSEMEKALEKFRGKIQQSPPVFSAVKIRGKSAYKLARKGIVPKMEPRAVEIKKISLESYRWPYARARMVTGPGVYIRSFARDLGRALGTGGYLADLERTRVGSFTKEEALTLAQFRLLCAKNLSKHLFHDREINV